MTENLGDLLRQITRDDVITAIRTIDRGDPHSFGESTKYDLLFEGERYPPKAVVGIAATRILGHPLSPAELFGGGGSKGANSVLERLGFKIISKEPNVVPDKNQAHLALAQAPSPLTSEDAKRLLALIRRRYPDWTGFSDPRFVKEEIAYKQTLIKKAQELLSHDGLESLLQASQFDEFVKRLDQLGKHPLNNLLFRGVPSSGDLGILYQPSLDKPTFASAVMDLLYGSGPSEDRLEKYVGYVVEHGLPNKWTFPTFYLFLCHPDDDVFVKPSAMKVFLRIVGRTSGYNATPARYSYASIKQVAGELRSLFSEFGPQNMVDMQSLMWVCAREEGQPEAPVQGSPRADHEPAFSSRAFTLLEELRRAPTQTTYQGIKPELEKEVVEPFKNIVRRIALSLPQSHRDALETENRIFSIFLKNDYGKRGVWDFYWSAFYPRGSERTKDAQLFVVLRPEVLDFGFSFGHYASEQRSRLLRSLEANPDVADRFFEALCSEDGWVFGDPAIASAPKSKTVWRSWLGRENDLIRIARRFSRDQVIEMPSAALVTEIASAFQRLFPLMAMAASDQEVDRPQDLLADAGELPTVETEPPAVAPVVTLDDCAAETNLPAELLSRWIRSLERKKQAILYGPPGTGKTFIANAIARHLISGSGGFVDLVQFHPTYSYEDFVQGIRPKTTKSGGVIYETSPGRFVEFCARARKTVDRCVMIIDEVNRANLSRVFGELMYLMEYRGEETTLAAGGRFSIPENVRLIGTMNTADRSIALVDHALRRRFAFWELAPDYALLERFQTGKGFSTEGLIKTLKRLNHEIGDPNHAIGMSFFLREKLEGEIEDIWRMEIEPYLAEYFFDRPSKAEDFTWDAVKDDILGWQSQS